MPSRKALLPLLLLFWVLALGPSGQAQTYLDSTGAPKFTTAFPVENGFINLSNGNLHLEFPLASYPQRGKLHYGAKMVYDSRIWTPANLGSGLKWYPINVPNSQGGWRFVDSGNVGSVSSSPSTSGYECFIDGPYGGQWVWQSVINYISYTWIGPDGTKREFSVAGVGFSSGGCEAGWENPNGEGFAIDGSGYLMRVTNYLTSQILAPDGTQVYPEIKDTNGNYFSYSSGNTVDTLGRTPISQSAIPSGPTGTRFTYLTTGTSAYIDVVTKVITPSTSFSQPGVEAYPGGSITVLDYIEFVNGTRYTFGYDSAGELNSITLPTGGVITYTYGIVADVNGNQNLWVTQRVRDTGTWTFAVDSCGTLCQTVKVHPPSANETLYTFNLNVGNPWNTKIESFSGAVSPNPMVSKTMSYDTSSPSVAITSEVTTWEPGSTNIKSQTTYTYDGVNARQLTSVKQWDFIPGGDSFAPTPTRETVTAYSVLEALLAKNILDRPIRQALKQAGVDIEETYFEYDPGLSTVPGVNNHDDANYSSSNTTRGNLSLIRKCKLFSAGSCWGSGYALTSFAYNTLGNVISTTDPEGHTTSFTYSNQHAYIFQITLPNNGFAHVTQTVYDNNTGLVLAQCGENYSGTCAFTATPTGADQITYTYDDLLRPTHAYSGDGGQSDFYYPTTTSNTSRVRHKIDSSNWTDAQALYDAYGRPIQSFSANGQAGNNLDLTATCYDSSGRVGKAIHPQQSTAWLSSPCTENGDLYAYDPLGRLASVTHLRFGLPTTVAYHSYSAYTSGSGTYGILHTFTDESSKVRKFVTDGLGRQIRTGERVGSADVWTDYTYNARDQVTAVAQGDRLPRTFEFDGRGLLRSATSPEAGLVSYTFNGDGTLATRVRPKANQTNTSVLTTTTYTYDALHRLLTTSYANSDSSTNTTAALAFHYDEPSITVPSSLTLNRTTGRLSRATAALSSPSFTSYNIFSYDLRGRVASNWQTTPVFAGTPKLRSYTYDLLGNIKTEADFLSKVYTHTYNVAGRPTGMTSNAAGPTRPDKLLSEVTYNAFGQAETYFLGKTNHATYPFAGVKTTATYNGLGQLTAKTAIDNGGTGNTRYNLSADYYNNGNLNNSNDGVAWTHSYDDVNRLITSDSAGTDFNMTYDRDGNRLTQNGQTFSYNADNRISSGNGVTYDALGNIASEVVSGSTRYYTYDAENRLIEISGGITATYVYDAFGRRIKKTSSPTISPSREYFYDLAGRMVIEVSGAVPGGGGWWASEYYAGGLHVGTFTSGKTYFSHQDYLGTERVKTDENGVVAQTCTFGPFGDTEVCTGGINSMVKYAGYDRDPESGLDHMWFRYYNPRLGRFLTTDPYGGSMDISDPQSMNRYTYVGGNPTNYVDPVGLDMCDIQYSFQECGGWAGIYGGYFGTGYASYMREFGGIPEAVRDGYGQYLDMVAQSRSGMSGGVTVTCSSAQQANGSCIEVRCDALSEPGDWWCNPTLSFLPVICGSTCGRFIGPNASTYYGAVQIVGQSEVPVTVAAAGAIAIPAVFILGYEAAPLLYPLRADGPNAGWDRHMDGRIFGVRYGSFTIFRLDYQFMSSNDPYKNLHIHLFAPGNSEGIRFPVMPKRR